MRKKNKRHRCGRKPVSDKVKAVTAWLRESEIAALGGQQAAALIATTALRQALIVKYTPKNQRVTKV
jgi:hypothetical protein